MPRFKLEASLRTPTPSCLPTLMASFRHHGTTQTISYHFLRRRLHRLEKRNRYPAQLQDQHHVYPRSQDFWIRFYQLVRDVCAPEGHNVATGYAVRYADVPQRLSPISRWSRVTA